MDADELLVVEVEVLEDEVNVDDVEWKTCW